MSLYDDGFAVSRGTVLVASGSTLFMEIVRDMVADCGLAVIVPLTSEPAWLSVMRTQPSLVICDWDAPAASRDGVIGEAAARHVPLLMAWSRNRHEHYARGLALPERVAWLTFPVGHDEFRSTINALLAPEIDSVHRVSLAVPGIKLGVGVRMRTLSLLA
jgi:DNA-binding response OmpR family regulator